MCAVDVFAVLAMLLHAESGGVDVQTHYNSCVCVCTCVCVFIYFYIKCAYMCTVESNAVCKRFLNYAHFEHN